MGECEVCEAHPMHCYSAACDDGPECVCACEA